MAITKAQKDEILKDYVEMLRKAKGLVITEYRGMSMKNFNTTRSALRAVQGTFTVTKNTLFKLALKENGFAVPEDLLVGPTAVAVAYNELGPLTKVVLQRAKEDELLVLKGAIMGKNIYSAKQLDALSTLPTLDEARASLIGTLQQPASRFIGLIGQPGQGLAALLKAYTDDHQGGNEQTEAA